MNKFIKEQLNKCKIAKIPNFDDNTVEIFINKLYNDKKLEFEINQEYDIELENYIIHPYSGFTLHDNWNNGIIPTDKDMHILITKDIGKMMCVQAVGLNDKKSWGGWLPKKSCKIL